jgi:death-on-curing protein
VEEPRWFVRAVADVLHQRLIDQYGGSPGIRDPALVDSALARPVNRWSYSPDCDLADLAASYAYGLAKNHGYIDGNKRIAFTAMAVFLYINGLLLEAPHDEAVRVMIEIASGERSENELANWLRGRVAPPPIGSHRDTEARR